ncbi:MAG: hypothetical protein P8X96_06295 [Desulfobacteraceae bacterium]
MDQPTAKQSGRIITFYSYKGGTGRTMALANVGCLLANQLPVDKKILMIDWDLEAPGLHHYFRDRIAQKDLKTSEDVEGRVPGLIDLFQELDRRTPEDPPESGTDEEKYADGALSQVQIDDYVLMTHEPNLFLMKAGAFDENYVDNTSTFDWEGLYARSPMLFISLAHKLAEKYQYVLIDSRTGLTDTSGICTMLMPERLVLVFTPNRQSLAGVLDLVGNATEYRRQSEDLRPLMVFPLPSRIEASEPERRELWRFGDKDISGYEPLFEKVLTEAYGLKQCSLGKYFDDVQVQHVPQYAYGEEIAVLMEKRSDKLSLTRTYQTFLEKIVHTNSPWEEISRETLSDYATVIAETKSELKSQASESKRTKRRFAILSAIALVLVLVFGVISYQYYSQNADQVSKLEKTLAEIQLNKDKLASLNEEVVSISSEVKTNGKIPYDKVTVLENNLAEMQDKIQQLTNRSESEFVKKEISTMIAKINDSLQLLDRIKNNRLK